MRLLLLILAPFLFLYGGEKPAPPKGAPWFTGPLITPFYEVVPGGTYDVEPYLYLYPITADFNSDWSKQEQSTLWILTAQGGSYVGITSWMDVVFLPSVSWQWCENKYSMQLNDFQVLFDFALWTFPDGSFAPSAKLSIGETFPTGQYRNLGSGQLGTDVGGRGSYQQNVNLVLGQQYYFGGEHWFNYQLACLYTYFVPVHVKGFNTYGGGSKCNGTVYPGQELTATLGLQYSLTYNWALALDVTGVWTARDRFTGRPGSAEEGRKVPNRYRSSHQATVGQGAAFQFSLAPAIEYNWNQIWGVIFGSQVVITGRNTTSYAAAIFALNINIGLP